MQRYKITGNRVLTNSERCYADYVAYKPEGQWPAYFVGLVVKALAAEIALAITDRQSFAEHWHVKAFGTPSQNGLGGEMGVAMTLDAQLSPDSMIDADAFTTARFGG